MNKFILIGLFFSSGLSAQPSVLFSSAPVDKIEVVGFQGEESQAVQKALELKVGRPMNLKAINEGIRRLHTKGQVEMLFVESSTEGGSLKVLVRGQPVHKVTRVKFTNIDEDVLEEVKSRISVDEEDQYGSQALATIRDKIRQAYEARGYYLSDVRINYIPTEKNQFEAEVVIQKNEPARIAKVSVYGGTKEENAAMREQATLRSGSIFRRKDLEETVDKINDYLQTNQYPTSKVENTSFKFSADRKAVDINVLVRMNERYQFQFAGNTVFDEVELRELLTEDVLLQNDSATRVAALLEAKYRTIGYHFCKVQVQVTEKEKLNIIRFVVDEGSKVRIDSVDFSGGIGEFSRDELATLLFQDAPGVLKRRIFWEEGIQEAVNQLRRKLDNLGYLSSSVPSPRVIFTPDRKGADLFFDVEVGTRTIVSGLELKGIRHFSREEIEQTLGIRVGEFFSREKLAEGKQRLLLKYHSEGYADVKYLDADAKDNGATVSRDYRQALVVIDLVEGTRYTVGTITVEGNRKTQPHVITREMKLNEGDLFDPGLVRASEESVSTLGLFSRVEVVPTNDPKNPTRKNLKIVVRENQPGLGEIGLGGFYEDPRLRLRTFVGVTYRNLFGQNHTASARTELALPFSLQKRLIPFIEYSGTLGYRSPYPLGIPAIFAAQFVFDSFEVSTVAGLTTIQTRTRVEGRLEKKLSRSITGVYKLYQLERTRQEILDDPSSVKIDLIGSTGPGLVFDLRDDQFNPTKGSYHTLNLEIASPLLLSNDNISFYMLISRNSFYLPLVWNMGLSFYAGMGYAQSLFDGETIPVARLTYDLSLGGSRSIRGFSVRRFSPQNSNILANPVEKTAFYNGRAELTIPVFSNFSGAVFLDTGEIFPNMRGAGRHDGVGVGIRYKTPVGPVVVDLAQGLGKDREDIKFYFTVGSL